MEWIQKTIFIRCLDLLYLGCMILISYIGSEKFGGKNILTFGWDMVVIACLALSSIGGELRAGLKQNTWLRLKKSTKNLLINNS